MDLLTSFKNYLFSQEVQPSKVTVKNYLSDINHFVNWFSKKYNSKFIPGQINAQVIEDYKKENASIFSASSLQRHLSSLRKFFKFLKLQEQITFDPFDSIAMLQPEIKDYWKLKDFKSSLFDTNAAHLTIKNYIIDVKQFIAWAKEATGLEDVILPGRITKEFIEEYKLALSSSKGFSPASVNRKLSSLRKYLTWAEQNGILTEKILDFTNINEAKQKLFIPETPEFSQPESIVKTYSRIPPIRLAQKISQGLLLAFDATLVLPLASSAKKAQDLVWTLRGKPIFHKNPQTFQVKNITHKDLLGIKNISKKVFAPSSISVNSLSPVQKLLFHARYTRPNWYRRYHSYAITHYFHFAVLIIFIVGLTLGFYNSFFGNQSKLLAAPNLPTSPNRILSFQGRLTDSTDNPITSPTNLRFGIYTQQTPGTGSGILLWQEVDQVSPDTDGIFNTLLGSGPACANPIAIATGQCAIPSTLFSQNAALFLGVSVESTAELTPRQQIATVAYAANSETLQGLLPITATAAGTTNVVLALDSSGNLTIGGSAAPSFSASGGQFKLSGQPLLLTTNDSSNSNVIISPNGIGKIDVQKPLQNNTLSTNIRSGSTGAFTAAGAVEVNDQFAVLATSSGQSAFTINQDSTGPVISASVSGLPVFTVDNGGNISNSGNYSVAGTGGITVSGTGAGITFSGTGNHDISASGGTLRLGALTLNGAITGGNQNITSIGNISANSSSNTITGFGTIGTAATTNFTGLNLTITGSLSANGSTGSNTQCLTGGATASWVNCASGTNWWTQTGGVIYPIDTGLDFAIGGNSSASADFAILNMNPFVNSFPLATIAGRLIVASDLNRNIPSPVATISGRTDTVLVSLNNNGSGDLLTASRGGNTKFTIDGRGNLVLGNPTSRLSQTTPTISTGNTNLALTLNGDSTGNVQFFSSSNSIDSNGNMTLAGTTGLTLSSTGGLVLNGGTITDNTDEVDINDALAVSGILQVNGTSATTYNRIGTSTTNHSLSSANDLFVTGNLEADGTIFADAGLTVGSSQNLTLSGLTGNNQVLYANTSGVVTSVATTSTAGQCLNSGTTTPSWGSCGGYWQLNLGALAPFSDKADLLIGSSATASAKFAFTGLSSLTNQTQASFSGQFIVMPNNGFGGNIGVATTDMSGVVNIGSQATTPTIYNPNSGVGVIIRGNNAGTTGQLRIVPNTGAWADAQATTYFQITNSTNNNATFMGGTYGSDSQLSRLQFNSLLSTFTDSVYGSTPVPTALLEVIDTTASKVAFKVRAATSQSADIAQILDASSNVYLDVNSKGQLGVGTSSPTSQLHVTRPLSYTALGKSLAIFDQIENQDILTASASGTTRLRLTNGGNLLLTPGTGAISDTGNLTVNSRAAFGYDGTLQAAYISDADANKPLVFLTNDNSSTKERLRIDTLGKIGLGTTSPTSELHVTRALAQTATGKSLAIFDQIENQDIFTASSSGTSKFTISNTGGIGLGGGVGSSPSYGTSAQCLTGGSTAGWASCVLGTNWWGQTNGVLYPTDTSLDFALGGTATASAKFAVLNMNPAISTFPQATIAGRLNVSDDLRRAVYGPIATISGRTEQVVVQINNNGNGDLLTASQGGNAKFTIDPRGNIVLGNPTARLSQTTPTISTGNTNLALTLNGDSTGNVQFFSSSNSITSAGNLTIAGTQTINGASGNGLTFNNNGIAFDLVLQNGETIDNNTDNVVSLGFGAAGGTLNLSSTTNSVINASSRLDLQADGAIDVNIAGGSSATGCTVANSTGNLTCSGVLSANTTNTINGVSINSGTITATALALGTNPAAAGTLRLPNNTYITARNAANNADVNLIDIDSSNLVSFGANTAAFTLGGAIAGNNQNITSIGNISANSSSNTITGFGTIGTAATTNFTGLNLTITGSLSANGSTGSTTQCLLGGATAAWGSCGAGANWWNQLGGVLSPTLTSWDFALGGNSTSSALFAVLNMNPVVNSFPQATIAGRLNVSDDLRRTTFGPIATISGRTEQVALYINNNGNGDLLTASRGGNTKFTIDGRGNLVLGNPTARLSQTTPTISTGNTNATLTLNGDSTGNIQFFSSSNNLTSAGALTLASTITANTTGSINGLNINSGSLSGITGYSQTSGTFTMNGSGAVQLGTGTNTVSIGNTTGTLTLAGSGITANTNSVLYSGSSSVIGAATTAVTGLCLTSGANTPLWANCNAYSFWSQLNGTIFPSVNTNDLVLGGNSTASAKFAVLNMDPKISTFPIATIAGRLWVGDDLRRVVAGPIATISGRTSSAALTVNNSGNGDLFSASSSGFSRFVINNSGKVGINNILPSAYLSIKAIGAGAPTLIEGYDTTTGTNQAFTLNTDANGNGSLDLFLTGTKKVHLVAWSGDNSYILDSNFGLGTSTPTTKLDVAGSASLSGNLAFYGTATNLNQYVLNNSKLNFTVSPYGTEGVADIGDGFSTTNQGQLPQALSDMYQAPTSANVNGTTYIYVLGGQNSGGTTLSTVYKSRIDGFGNAGAFSATSNSLPAVRWGGGTATVTIGSSTYIYYVGGSTGAAASSTVYFATLSNSDGSPNAFQSTNSILATRLEPAVTIATLNGTSYIYALGGFNASGVYTSATSTVYRAQINTNGTLGTFQTNANTLPASRGGGGARTVTIGSSTYIYYVGGGDTQGRSTVYKATLDNSTGFPSAFTSVTGLPINRGEGGTEVITLNGTSYIYSLGGGDNISTVYSAAVYKTALDSTGNPGTWSSTRQSQLSQSLAYTGSTLITSGGTNYIFIIGGIAAGATAQSTVYRAGVFRPAITIANNGNVGIGLTNPATHLQIEGTSDVSLSSIGSFVIGDLGGNNVGFDNNEIQARLNGAAATLYLNHSGGGVQYDGGGNFAIQDSNLKINTTGSTSWYVNQGTYCTGGAARLCFSYGTSNGVVGFTNAGQGVFVGGTATGTPDYAENINIHDQSIEAGDIISTDTFDSNQPDIYQKSVGSKTTSSYQGSLIGAISENPGYLATQGNPMTRPDRGWLDSERPFAVAGRIPVKVSLINGDIKTGDPITSSEIPGIGMKATKPGKILGTAMMDYSNDNTATQAARLINGNWETSNITCSTGEINCHNYQKILVFINPTWFDPDVMLTSAGNINITDNSQYASYDVPHIYTLTNPFGLPIDRVGAFAQICVGYLKAGFIDAQQISTKSLKIATSNVTIAGQSLHDYIANIVSEQISTISNLTSNNIVSPIAQIDELHTNVISPVGQNKKVAIKLNDNQGDSKLEIQNSSGSALATFDSLGNASISGNLSSNNLLVSDNATVSGVLRASKIIADEIEGLNIKTSTIAANYITNNYYVATPGAFPTLPAQNSSNLNQIAGNYLNIASYSSQLANISSLSGEDAIFNNSLTVFGQTTLTDTSIVGQLAVGGNLILADEAINVLGGDLNLQPLRQGGLSIMAGLIYIDTNGNTTFESNATIKGTLFANQIAPLPGKDLSIKLASESAEVNKLVVKGASGAGVLAINNLGDLIASGEASFAKLNINSIVGTAYAISPTEVVASGSAGTVTLKAFKTEVTVNNKLVTPNSLIYITPLGSTANENIYLMRQTPGKSFTVGISNPISQDVKFNFLIVN